MKSDFQYWPKDLHEARLNLDRDIILCRMRQLERPGDVPGVLIEGSCVDVTEGGVA